MAQFNPNALADALLGPQTQSAECWGFEMMKPTNLSTMQRVLKETRDALGKQTQPYHYVNEINLIRFSLTEVDSPAFDLRNPAREHLKLLRRVVCLNIKLIRAHVHYKDRKQSCRDLVIKEKSPSK
jgi:hypothetical protein